MVEGLAILAIAVALVYGCWSSRNAEPASKRARISSYFVLSLILIGAVIWQNRNAEDEEVTGNSVELFADFRPVEEPEGEFVTSAQCLECHQDNHASWKASYHRTMTQVARAGHSMGHFTNQVVSFFGDRERYQLFEHIGLPWIRKLPTGAPAGPKDDSDGAMPALLTTGSHNMQAYWIPSGRGRMLNLMPLMYIKETEQWVPRRAVFLLPPAEENDPEFGRWNTTCIKCHTTDGRMNLPADQFSDVVDSKVSEFGISCEACHGGGRSHIEYQRQKTAGADDLGNDPIVNPGSVPHTHSAQICGSCHSVNSPDGNPDHWTPHPAAGDLEKERILFDFDAESRAWMVNWGGVEQGNHEQVESLLQQWFWKDGTPRVSGREYSGLRKTSCFTKGEMSCISCHSIHPSGLSGSTGKAWASDMLDPEVQGDQSCLQCHESRQYANISHTHHSQESSGSRCMNCHMPHTTYGLLKGIRSHAILSPSAKETVELGRPNACNLCHLDKSLKWTADHMTDWYEQPQLSMSGDQAEIAAGVLWTLTGDAGLRALTAWHMGWQPAQEASGTDWIPAYLAILLSDHYDAVRFVANRSVRSIGPFNDFEYDFLATHDERRKRGSALFSQWSKLPRESIHGRRDLLMGDTGEIVRDQFDRLLQARDNRPITLAE